MRCVTALTTVNRNAPAMMPEPKSDVCTRMGFPFIAVEIAHGKPSANNTSKMFDPNTFATAIVPSPRLATSKLTRASGSDVPMAPTVKPTTAGDSPIKHEHFSSHSIIRNTIKVSQTREAKNNNTKRSRSLSGPNVRDTGGAHVRSTPCKHAAQPLYTLHVFEVQGHHLLRCRLR